VSARHFLIQVRRTRDSVEGRGVYGLRLLDLSSNGTWVNDKLVGKDRAQPIRQGDRIFVLPAVRVGQFESLGFVLLTAPELQAPPPPAMGRERHLARVLSSSVNQCRLCGEAPCHRCVTAVPCGHNFDLGCLIAHRWESDTCPVCGEVIRQAVRNRVVDDVTSSFLVSKPDASRSDEALALLEVAEKNPKSAAILEQLMSGEGSMDDVRGPALPRLDRQRQDGLERVQLPEQFLHLQRYADATAELALLSVETSQNERRSAPTSAICVVS